MSVDALTRPQTSRQWLLLWQTEFGHLPTITDAARRLAPRFGMSVEACRKALSRSNTKENRIWLSDKLSVPSNVDPSVARQHEIIRKSKAAFEENQERLASLSRMSVGVFISDRHIPLHRKDCWELMCKILENMPHIDYITAMNDWADLKGWSLKWEDVRASREKLWAEDIDYSDRMEINDYETLRILAPEATLLGLMGNHDIWRYKFYRKTVPNGGERAIANHMQRLYDTGVLQFTRGKQENTIKLSPGLVWLHGVYAAKTALSNARNHLHLFTNKGEPVPNVVFGHTHRGSITHGHQLGFPGIKVVNNPAMCKNTGFDYLRLGRSSHWTNGFTVCYFSPNDWYTHIELVEFVEHGNKLMTRFNGIKYEVPLDRS